MWRQIALLAVVSVGFCGAASADPPYPRSLADVAVEVTFWAPLCDLSVDDSRLIYLFQVIHTNRMSSAIKTSTTDKISAIINPDVPVTGADPGPLKRLGDTVACRTLERRYGVDGSWLKNIVWKPPY